MASRFPRPCTPPLMWPRASLRHRPLRPGQPLRVSLLQATPRCSQQDPCRPSSVTFPLEDQCTLEDCQWQKLMREVLKKFQALIDDEDLEGLSTSLIEVESIEDSQEEYMLQLEREKKMLIDKIGEFGGRRRC